jgi:hypothetical protein
MFRRFIVFYLLLITAVQAEKAVSGLNFCQVIGGSWNYPGLLFTSRIFYRIPASEKNSILWESSKLDIGFCNELAPAFENPGLFFQYEPIGFFDLIV